MGPRHGNASFGRTGLGLALEHGEHQLGLAQTSPDTTDKLAKCVVLNLNGHTQTTHLSRSYVYPQAVEEISCVCQVSMWIL